MILTIYFIYSVVGLCLLHFASSKFSENQSNMWFVVWISVFVFFNSQQYFMLFEKEVLPYWFFFMREDKFVVTDFFRGVSFCFLILNTASLPPSRLGSWFKTASLLIKKQR